ncbi:hypothetical protein HQ587_05990 [bacterium]|nr:hypothetical protein [bacterium]
MSKYIILTLLLLFCLSLPCLAQDRWGREGAWGRIDPRWGRGLEAWTLEDLPYIVDWWRIDEGVTTDDTPSDSGDVVWAWYGSINGLSIAQSDNSKRPEYRTDQINGCPAIVFDGNDDYLRGLFGATYAQPNTIILVVKQPTSVKILFDVYINYAHRLYRYSSVFSMSAPTLRSVSGISPVTGVWTIISHVFDGASSIMRKDGVTGTVSASVGTNSFKGLVLGAKYDGSTNANISVTDVIICRAGLTTGQLQRAERWINEHRGGIY